MYFLCVLFDNWNAERGFGVIIGEQLDSKARRHQSCVEEAKNNC